jgi:DNA-binding response OmpR family regulator
MNERILVIEDEENIAALVKMYLVKEGYQVKTCLEAKQGLENLSWPPDLVILDLILPDANGLDICRKIREQKSTPVIMLTAKDTEVDKVVGLEVGADDYITKPFSPAELVARVKAVLRRTQPQPPNENVLMIGDVRVDVGRHQVLVKDKPVNLTLKEFQLLELLVRHKNLVLSRQQILQDVWGFDYLGETRTVDVHVRQLRAKLKDGCQIDTVWGIGYKITDEV